MQPTARESGRLHFDCRTELKVAPRGIEPRSKV